MKCSSCGSNKKSSLRLIFVYDQIIDWNPGVGRRNGPMKAVESVLWGLYR